MNVYSINVNDQGMVLVGTEDGLYQVVKHQLLKLNYDNEKLQSYIFFISRDYKGNMWFGTDNGIVNLTTDENISSYTTRRGLIGLETYTDAGKILSDGRIVVGFDAGISILSEERSRIASTMPHITNCKYQFKDEFRVLRQKKNVRLKGQDLVVSYSVPAFRKEEGNIVRYFLAGYDTSWNEQHSYYNDKIMYYNLPSGTYNLHIYAVSATGVSGPLFQSGDIKVSKTPWTWWMVLAYTLLLIAVVYYFVRRGAFSKSKALVPIKSAGVFEEYNQDNYEAFTSLRMKIMIISGEDLLIKAINYPMANFIGVEQESLIGKGIRDLIQEKEIRTMDKEDFTDYFLTDTREIVLRVPMTEVTYLFNVDTVKLSVENDDFVLGWILNDRSLELSYREKLEKIEANMTTLLERKSRELDNSLASFRHAMSAQEAAADSLRTAQKELKRLYKYERQQNIFKTNFIKTISHEYRTPLTIISSSAEIIKYSAEKGKTAFISPAVSKITNSIITLTELFDALATTGNTEVHPMQFELNYTIKDEIKRVSLMFEHNHHVTFTPYTKECLIRQDSQLLMQALFQVLSNAFKHTPAGTPIFIETNMTEDNQIVLGVLDHGNGVTPERLTRIFNKYDDSEFSEQFVTSERPGEGLGLALTKHNIELMGGTVEVTSEYGKWFKMTMRFPAELER